MGRNIESQRGQDRAREVARTVERVRAIADDYAKDPGDEDRVIRRVEDLYGDAGLPR